MTTTTPTQAMIEALPIGLAAAGILLILGATALLIRLAVRTRRARRQPTPQETLLAYLRGEHGDHARELAQEAVDRAQLIRRMRGGKRRKVK